jgi:hypothetical protein
VVNVVFQAVEIVLDHGDQTLIIVTIDRTDGVFFARVDALEQIALNYRNERQNLVDIGKPEYPGNNGLLAGE